VQGVQGIQGVPGLANLEEVSLQSASDSTSPKLLIPSCPGNKRALSASAYVGNSAGSVGFVALSSVDVPLGSNQGYAEADEVGGGTAAPWYLRVDVVCADVQ
jgi:hypothetical protein